MGLAIQQKHDGYLTRHLAFVRVQRREVKRHNLVGASFDHVSVTLQLPLHVQGISVVCHQEYVLSQPEVALEADLFRCAVSVRVVEAMEKLGVGGVPPRTRASRTIAFIGFGEFVFTGRADGLDFAASYGKGGQGGGLVPCFARYGGDGDGVGSYGTHM